MSIQVVELLIQIVPAIGNRSGIRDSLSSASLSQARAIFSSHVCSAIFGTTRHAWKTSIGGTGSRATCTQPWE
jgi:hypothetical protein